MTGHSAETDRLRQRLQDLIDCPVGNRCVECGHSGKSHNTLGYCQVKSGRGDCTCGVGVTVSGLVQIIMRDLPKVLVESRTSPAEPST